MDIKTGREEKKRSGNQGARRKIKAGTHLTKKNFSSFRSSSETKTKGLNRRSLLCDGPLSIEKDLGDISIEGDVSCKHLVVASGNHLRIAGNLTIQGLLLTVSEISCRENVTARRINARVLTCEGQVRVGNLLRVQKLTFGSLMFRGRVVTSRITTWRNVHNPE
jgi:hypothetical protein